MRDDLAIVMNGSDKGIMKKNIIQCKKCKDIIESVTRHDFRRCKCGSIVVDGGTDYLKVDWPGGDVHDWVEFDEANFITEPGHVRARARELSDILTKTSITAGITQEQLEKETRKAFLDAKRSHCSGRS